MKLHVLFVKRIFKLISHLTKPREICEFIQYLSLFGFVGGVEDCKTRKPLMIITTLFYYYLIISILVKELCMSYNLNVKYCRAKLPFPIKPSKGRCENLIHIFPCSVLW